MEPLPAVLAGVRPGVGVDEEVGGERAGPLEGLPTLLALKHLLDAVDRPEEGTFIRLMGITLSSTCFSLTSWFSIASVDVTMLYYIVQAKFATGRMPKIITASIVQQ